MIKSNIYCQASSMVMKCIHDLDKVLPVVCEIGCADGQGVARYGGFCKNIICVDPMIEGRPDIVSYEKQDFMLSVSKLNAFKKNTSHVENIIQLIIGCSAWKETLECVKSHAGDNGIDILLIDGVHHPFDAVWKDFELYYPLVNKDGFIIFDDTYEDCIQECVDKALAEYNLSFHLSYRSDPPILQEIVALRKNE